jgi:hypothetical protein
MSKVQVDKVVNLSDDGAPQLTYGAELPVGYGLTGAGGLNISGVVTAASAVFSGNVTIGGTLTYEDVTNIDVVGVSTFAGRMNVNSTINANEGINVSAGVITAPSGFSGDLLIEDKIVHTGDTNTALRFPSADTITAETGGSERVRITSDGNLGVGDNSPDVRLHVTETVDVAYTVDTVTSEANNLVKLENPSTTANAFSGMQFRVGSGADMFVGAIQQSANAGDLYVVNQNAPNKELLRIKSTSKVGLGTNNPQLNLHIHSESSNASFTHFTNTTTGVSASDGVSIGLDSDENAVIYNYESTAIRFATAGSERVRISSSGFVGVGTANPVRKLHVADDNSEIMLVQSGNASGSYINYKLGANGAELGMLGSGAAILSGGADAADFGIRSSGDLCFSSGGHAERARFDTSGRLLVGSTSSRNAGDVGAQLQVEGTTYHTSSLALIANSGASAGNNSHLTLAKSRGSSDGSNTILADGDTIGIIQWAASDGTDLNSIAAEIRAKVDGAPGSNDMPGRLVFGTTADGASSPTERMRIDNQGRALFNTTVNDPADDGGSSNTGTTISEDGYVSSSRSAGASGKFGRVDNDGIIVNLYQDGTAEGNISVSGSTVSYNGGHLSRWSQLVGISTNVKSDRPTIYQGTVMSNLDAMCEWTGETNQQLNKTKVSDTVSDKDVAGVFWTWDDDDDVYTNDFYVAMTGDMVVRVGAATTITRGDLLESAGDGTAKPQSDDIVRSKTVAKITSTTSTATYSDGSKAYPCVLMAC